MSVSFVEQFNQLPIEALCRKAQEASEVDVSSALAKMRRRLKPAPSSMMLKKTSTTRSWLALGKNAGNIETFGKSFKYSSWIMMCPGLHNQEGLLNNNMWPGMSHKTIEAINRKITEMFKISKFFEKLCLRQFVPKFGLIFVRSHWSNFISTHPP